MTHPFSGGGLDAEKCVSQVFLNQETQILDRLPKPELSCKIILDMLQFWTAHGGEYSVSTKPSD